MTWRRMIFVGAAALGLVFALSTGAGEGGLRGEIQALLDEQARAWTAGDLEEFCSVYAEDAVFISTSGLTRGRQKVLERYRRRYPDKSAMGTLTLEILEVRVAGRRAKASSVSAVGRWTLSYPEKAAVTGLTLLVLHRTKGGPWRIVQDASM
jgi:uncharacterized protein (TIGR02246 family)